MTFAQMLQETYTDGIAVLHKGKLIYERYFGALKPHKPHIAMSVTKSFTGTLAGILVARRQSWSTFRNRNPARLAMRGCTRSWT